MPGASDNPDRPFPLATAFVLYVLGFAVLAWPWLSGSVTIPGDAKSLFFPQLAFLAQSFGEGQSPFWTPHVHAGWPQVADPHALIFSPLHVLLALFNAEPTFRAADAVTFAHLFLGGLSIVLIFRERGWHPAGALVAALSFAFGGASVSGLSHIAAIESASWFLLALWLLMHALGRASLHFGVAAGIAAGLLALGRNQVALLGLILLAGFVLWHWLAGAGRSGRLVASLKPLAAALAACILVAAVPVLLTALLVADAAGTAMTEAAAARGSLHPATLFTLAFADLFAAAMPGIEPWGPASAPWQEAFGAAGPLDPLAAGRLYQGALVAIVVLGFGLARGWLWAGEVRFFTVALALMLLYALGSHASVFLALHEAVPGAALFRRPADAAFLFGALLAIAAGYLVHRWLGERAASGRSWQGAVQVAIVIGLIAAAFGLAGAVGRVSEAVAPVLTGIVVAALGIGALLLARSVEPMSPLAAAAVLAVFCTADLAWNNRPYASNGMPPEVYDMLRPDSRNETVALLKWRLAANAAPDRRDRVEMTGLGAGWPNIGQVHRFDHVFGDTALRLRDVARATRSADAPAGPGQRPFAPLMASYQSPLKALFGVRFVATGVPVDEGDLDFVARTKDGAVYENPRALPRAMLLNDWREADFAAIVESGVWPDANPARTVLLERTPEGLEPGAEPGRAAIVRYRNTEVEVVVDSPEGGVLVLNDVWHPWWRATLDGEPAALLKANVLFRAVIVPAGQHVVRFRFHPFAGAVMQLRDKLRQPWRN